MASAAPQLFVLVVTGGPWSRRPPWEGWTPRLARLPWRARSPRPHRKSPSFQREGRPSSTARGSPNDSVFPSSSLQGAPGLKGNEGPPGPPGPAVSIVALPGTT